MILFLYTFSLFLSAFLLFLVQPMFAKMVLPFLGGTPQVWNACMVFFQFMLLAGYGYAHAMTTRAPYKFQRIFHFALTLAPLFFLPIAVPSVWQPDLNHPILSLLKLFTSSAAWPFLILSTTAPLLQKWFSYSDHPDAENPYFLYAASNAGSLSALLFYPIWIEPYFTLRQQSLFWTAGYAALCGALWLCGRAAQKSSAQKISAAAASQRQRQIQTGTAPRGIEKARWIFWAFIPSSLMLGVTTYIATDIAPVPLIWILPLALYLLTFILVFSKRASGHLNFYLARFPFAVVILALLLASGATDPLLVTIPVHVISFFIIALYCHHRLAAYKPAPEFLTEFYFCMSLGGMLGGFFNAILAPVLFPVILEYPAAIVLSAFVWQGYMDQNPPKGKAYFLLAVFFAVTIASFGFLYRFFEFDNLLWRAIAYGIPCALCFYFRDYPKYFRLLITFFLLIAMGSGYLNQNILAVKRSFFGVNIVRENEDFRFIKSGTTFHGMQSRKPEEKHLAYVYYHASGPIGQVFQVYNTFPQPEKRRIAMLGMGSGSTVTYGQERDHWTFYEIDRAVVDFASEYFSFLKDAKASHDIVLGDARLMLNQAKDAELDMIIVDVFSSDAIPVHLLTKEALGMYLRKLKPEGVLAFHISNRYLDLQPVVAGLAAHFNLRGLAQYHKPGAEKMKDGISPSHWVVAAREGNPLIQELAKDSRWQELKTEKAAPVWADDYSNIFRHIRW
jgi:hypothetical protein